jgi:transposase InsO family protein
MKDGRLPEETFKSKPLEDFKEVEPMAKKKKELTNLSDLENLELENALPRELVIDLKKVDGWHLTSISNKQKVRLGERLRQEPGRSLREITDFLKISKSSYEYHRKRLLMPDKLAPVRGRISTLFWENKARYGSRRIWALLRSEDICISEKVVRRIMKELGLLVRYEPKAKRFYSYEKGMPGAVDNLVKRNFNADRKNSLWLTDITEFRFDSFKCYLSPIIDCFDGKVVAWNISKYPDASLVNDMLAEAITTLKSGEHPILHTDRGAHYRWPGWLEQCDKAGLIRSMSAKGYTPDNAACEGFFGRLKNEFFNYRSWKDFLYEQFTEELNEYIAWYYDKRIKESLGWMSPNLYRLSLGLVA